HSRAEFVRVVQLTRNSGLNLSPTFVTFTPWTSLEGYLELLSLLAELELAESVSPIQLAIRLLIPAGSRLLILPEVRRRIGAFSESALSYQWQHDDARVDALYHDVQRLVSRAQAERTDRIEIFFRVWKLAERAIGYNKDFIPVEPRPARATIPY